MATEEIQPGNRTMHRETDAAAVRSFRFSLAFLLTPLPSLIAIYYGILGIDRTRNNAAEGRRLAITGLVLGLAGIIFWLVVLLGLRWIQSSIIVIREQGNVHSLLPTIADYVHAHNGNLPEKFYDFNVDVRNLHSKVIYIAAGANLKTLPRSSAIAVFDLSDLGEDRMIVLYADLSIPTRQRKQALLDIQTAIDRRAIAQRASTQPAR